MKANLVRVVIVGQTPPPHLGGPIMLQYLVRSQMKGVELHHLPIKLSTDKGQVGKIRWGKLVRLFQLIFRILRERFIRRPQILYYAPELMEPRTTVMRDAAIVAATRLFFPKFVLHFHSSGYDEYYDQLPRWQRWLLPGVYFGADAAIRISELNSQDGRRLGAKREYVVPNGIDDPCPEFASARSKRATNVGDPLRILFVGMLRESKGVLVLIEACAKLATQGVLFELEVMGPWKSDDFAARVHRRIQELKLSAHVRFLGVLVGDEKFAAYREADVLCFPTFFRSESFGLVLLEAMACRLPVVTTRWRGIPSVVEDGETGFLVEPHDPDAVADRLAELAYDVELRERMGDAGRRKFEAEFVLSRHLEEMRKVLLEVSGVEHKVVREIPNTLATTEV